MVIWYIYQITMGVNEMKNDEKIKEFKSIARSRLEQDSRSVYMLTQLRHLMVTIKEDIGLPKRVTAEQMIKILESSKKLKIIKLSFPSQKYTRYTWGEKSIYDLLSSLNGDAYYSHLSALYFHKLLETEASEIYLNIEQSQKSGYSSAMHQENIDKAFSRPPRITRNVASYQQWRIFLLNGMYTDRMGVIKMTGPKKQKILVTDLERTLIDIAVRPHYSGGVANVLNVYKKAVRNVSIDKMVNRLKELNYSYPYHQSIGFYLESSGLTSESSIFGEAFPIQFKFYLDYQMDKISYSEKWKVYYPKDLLRSANN